MPARLAPTARQRRLGTEMRRLRQAAGLSVADAALKLGWDRTRISNIEAGRTGLSHDSVSSLAGVYQCADRAYVDALGTMAEERGKGWWEEFRGKFDAALLDLVELEQRADHLRGTQVTHLPGLLQTESYARAVLSTDVPAPDPTDLRRKVSFRMRRRDVLDKEDAPQCTLLIHEAALRLGFGGPAVMREQLTCILESSDRENITIRALPFSLGGLPGIGASITYVSGAVSQLDTVHFDTPTGVQFLDAPTATRKYRSMMDRLEELSLPVEKTRDFVREISKQL
ncbi:helix-turn-helix domain-containing protein [Streptomyces xiamenensis]|uniref:helix-turn-helix domain-containing protein n=1 Tax=Streptomyces xiamenensis TaxID=408015 RepID=UPI0036CCE681